MKLRTAAAEDYDRVVAVIDEWWVRPVSIALPRLFFDHFWPSSTIAEDEDGLAGFLVAFVSPALPELGYIHFVGVRPDLRKQGLARLLYSRFEAYARGLGCRELRAVTSPSNASSIRFHRRLGFRVEPVPGYNGPGRPMVVFSRRLPRPGPSAPPRAPGPTRETSPERA
jgi:ribosomal protein S18 acetylase RimI-like enzyme